MRDGVEWSPTAIPTILPGRASRTVRVDPLFNRSDSCCGRGGGGETAGQRNRGLGMGAANAASCRAPRAHRR